MIDNSLYKKEHDAVLDYVKNQIGIDLNDYRDGDGTDPNTTTYWDVRGVKLCINWSGKGGMNKNDQTKLKTLVKNSGGKLIMEQGGAWFKYLWFTPTCVTADGYTENDNISILFSREWSKDDIRKVVKENCYLHFGEHKDLKSLCILPFAEDETFYHPDYYEMTFVVPLDWLRDTVSDLFEVDDLDYWLQNEYTTDESEIIFEKALNERQVVMVDFDK